MASHRFLFIVEAVALVLVSIASAEKGDHGYEQRLREALESAKRQLHINDTTPLRAAPTCLSGTGYDFDCPMLSHPNTPSTVDELTPYDINIVAALGDSVTTAVGARACTILDDLIAHPGDSWSIGGKDDIQKVATLPNILRKYNPNLIGFSTSTNSRAFNVAVGGSIAQDMPGQAIELVAKMKSDLTEDQYNNDWKIVTLWIGGNNLCSFCKNPEKHSPENYINNIEAALDTLQELPRTFINIVQIIDVTRLEPLKGLVCNLVRPIACDCVTDQATSQAATDYQTNVNNLIESGRYDGRDDFTVVVQPFFIGMELPYENGQPDKSYFAPDCFHFSTKGHAEGAKALWQNMFEPVGSKSTHIDLGGPLYCPTEDNKYFYTKKNSPPPSSFGDTAHVTAPSSDDGSNLIGVITGSAVGVAALVATVLAVTAVLAYKLRKRQNRGNRLENLPLVGNRY